MSIGDVVMFIDDGRYAKYFWGQLGKVSHYTPKGNDGRAHCRVEWMQPVPYHGRTTTASDFPAEYFKVLNESR